MACAFHHLGLLHLAIPLYERAISLPPPTPSAGTPFPVLAKALNKLHPVCLMHGHMQTCNPSQAQACQQDTAQIVAEGKAKLVMAVAAAHLPVCVTVYPLQPHTAASQLAAADKILPCRTAECASRSGGKFAGQCRPEARSCLQPGAGFHGQRIQSHGFASHARALDHLVVMQASE